jgi:hypothetical protein
MAKFPSQRKMVYQTGAISTGATSGGAGTWHGVTSGGVAGDLNLPKDLSLLNRRGYASTTRKGVPLVYQCKIDFYLHDEDGLAVGTAFGSDAQAVLKIDGCQNNWVMKNAAVKWHAAREQMLKEAGVKKGSRGAYAHEIRYNYDSNSDTWLVPIDGDGDAFTGGTWDVTTLGYTGDTGFQLKLVGAGDDEEADAFSGSVLSIGHSYLLSRSNVIADTNPERDEAPAKFSVLNNLLDDPFRRTGEVDDIRDNADGEQDNPPYEVLDISDSGDVNHDITEPVELGRAVAGLGNAYGSTIVEIPFGLANLKAKIDQAASFSMTPSALICVEVLDIYEMQG